MSLKINVIANFSGSTWAALMSLVFVPFYIDIMGVESFGIIGVFVSLMAVLSVLDLGLSHAMNREMAKVSDKKNISHKADTARTLEVIYWGIAILVGGGISLLAGPIAEYWLNPEQLTQQDLQQAILIMGLVIALRWPVSLYMGGLNGLQRQVHVNVLISVIATMQGLGALLVLLFVSPTIQAFFMWQVVMALIQVIAFRIALWNSMPYREGAVFSKVILIKIWRFAAGMSGVSILAIILTQVDKVILSKILTLTEFGYYAFATTVAGILFRLMGPVFTAFYPRLTELVSKGDRRGLINSYHQGSQLMAVVLLPIAFVLVFFSKEILELWTGNTELILHASVLISLLAIGNALNGLMQMPYALQLAHGWTKLAFYTNLVAVIVLVPAIYFATLHWGAIGAAVVWIGLNTGYVVVVIHIMHRRLFRQEKWRWYLGSVIYPLLGVIGVGLAFRGMMFISNSKLTLLIWMMVSAIAMIITTALITPYFRRFLIAKVSAKAY